MWTCKKLVPKRNIAPLLGEVSANFCDIVAWSAQRIGTAIILDFLDPQPLFSYLTT
jgi:hypothetical protein